IAFRVEETASGFVVHSTWLQDDSKPQPAWPEHAAEFESWRYAPLARMSGTHPLSEIEAKEHFVQAQRAVSAPEPVVAYVSGDPRMLVIESISDGQRRAHMDWEDATAWNLYCALVELSRIPKDVLVQGGVYSCTS